MDGIAEPQIKLYGAEWCPDCRRAKQFLEEHGIAYGWRDIEKDREARVYVQQVNGGKRIIPTIIFADGSVLVEPTDAALAKKLGALLDTGRDR